MASPATNSAAHSPKHIVACPLGRLAYKPTWTLQQELQRRLIETKRQPSGETLPHLLLLVEHPPVYTLGKSGDDANLLLSEERLAERGATFHHIDRGGDITFHGPGQLVAYPLLDLDRFFTDLGRYLRTLEEVVIRTCAEYGLTGRRVEGRTGVWIGPDASGPERKICAMGIRCSRWVTMHGLALNLNTDLTYFDDIVPCGIADRGVTSLAAELDEKVDEEEVQKRLLAHFADCFSASLQRLDPAEVAPFLENYLATPAHKT